MFIEVTEITLLNSSYIGNDHSYITHYKRMLHISSINQVYQKGFNFDIYTKVREKEEDCEFLQKNTSLTVLKMCDGEEIYVAESYEEISAILQQKEKTILFVHECSRNQGDCKFAYKPIFLIGIPIKDITKIESSGIIIPESLKNEYEYLASEHVTRIFYHDETAKKDAKLSEIQVLESPEYLLKIL